MNLQDAVQGILILEAGLKRGLQALGGHSIVVQCSPPNRLQYSLNIEVALLPILRNGKLWDYAVGWVTKKRHSCVCFIEVHPANNAHVNDIIEKKRSLETWIRTNAQTLLSLKDATIRHLTEDGDDPTVFHWISTSARIALTRNDPKRRALNTNGISGPKRSLILP